MRKTFALIFMISTLACDSTYYAHCMTDSLDFDLPSYPLWYGLRCWDTGADPTCIGSLSGQTFRVIAPSVWAAEVASGRYVRARPPWCQIDQRLDSLKCYSLAADPSSRVCVGEYDGVLIPTPNPCLDEPVWPFVDVFGLYAWRDSADEYASAVPIPWPG